MYSDFPAFPFVRIAVAAATFCLTTIAVNAQTIPTCGGRVASIYVDKGMIVGGPQNGQSFDGTLIGTPGDDVIVGTSADDIIQGRGGNDTICAGPGNDSVDGGPGDDLIEGGPGDDDIKGD